MYDSDAIEAINVEQLATVTDRLLLRGRMSKHTPGRRATTAPAFARGSQPEIECTVFVNPPAAPWRRFVHAALITSVFSVTAAIASLI